jgi:hypothetical protein
MGVLEVVAAGRCWQVRRAATEQRQLRQEEVGLAVEARVVAVHRRREVRRLGVAEDVDVVRAVQRQARQLLLGDAAQVGAVEQRAGGRELRHEDVVGGGVGAVVAQVWAPG